MLRRRAGKTAGHDDREGYVRTGPTLPPGKHSAGLSDRPALKRLSVLTTLLVALLGTFLLFAASSLAGTVTNERPFLFSFDGADATGGPFSRDSEHFSGI